MEKVEAPSFLEDGDSVFVTKTSPGTKEKNKKLQGHRADFGDVKVVRIVCYSLSGKGNRARKLAVTRGKHWWHQLSAPSGNDDAVAAEALGVARGRKTNDEAQQRWYDPHAMYLTSMDIKDGIWCGKTEAHCQHCGRS